MLLLMLFCMILFLLIFYSLSSLVTDRYFRMFEATQDGLGRNAPVHSIHGSLLAVGELLRWVWFLICTFECMFFGYFDDLWFSNFHWPGSKTVLFIVEPF